MSLNTFILTVLTLIAFASNSLLCRAALGRELIDPMSFTAIRLVSGALALIPIARFAGETRHETAGNQQASWLSGLALFTYAATFSLAYVSLTTGTGALILFGCVQATMIGWGLHLGEKLAIAQVLGLAGAIGGLIYLVLPGVSAPSLMGAVLMSASGVAWGVYSIRGKGGSAPINSTAGNFFYAAVLAIAGSFVAFATWRWNWEGVALALTSGVVTSGLGYVLWYKTLPNLTTTQASSVQLTVPIIAALSGIAFLGEQPTLRLLIATILILGGVTIVILSGRPLPTKN